MAAAAEQYSMTPQEYCSQMRNKGVWGGGPEILALVNRLRRPIHVFEPVPACNGTQVGDAGRCGRAVGRCARDVGEM